jgi:hypothetical protein
MVKLRKISKFMGLMIVVFMVLLSIQVSVGAHCDTVDGPVIIDAKKAIETGNLNYVLKWVKQDSEKEITDIFELAMRVRKLDSEAKELSDRYFFENLVRIHREGEGAPFTGLKPSGTHIDEKVLAADKSIETGDLSPLESMVSDDKKNELSEKFDRVMKLKNFDVNDVDAGREYVEAYVAFFHLAEGEHEGEHAEENHASDTHETIEVHAEGSEVPKSYLQFVPWILSSVFLFTTLAFGVLYFRGRSTV